MADIENSFRFDLVTPDRVVASGDVSMVLIPGPEGEFGILPRHSSMLSTVHPGILTVQSPKGDVIKMFISSGFADVNEKRCAVLVETAVRIEQLDLNDLKEELIALKKDQIDKDKSSEERLQIAQEILYTEMKIKAKRGNVVKKQ